MIVSGNYSLAKANGQPFSLPLVDDDWWPFYFSTAVNPLLVILEFVWSRLDLLYDLGGLWGEDLELEVPHIFLLAKASMEEDGTRSGWNYQFVNTSAASLEGLGDVEEWEPRFLSTAQWVVLASLCQGKTVRFDDDSLVAFLADENVTDLAAFWHELLGTGLVARSSDNTELILITTKCQTAVLPDGQLIAAENNTGRMFRWMHKRFGSHKYETALQDNNGAATPPDPH
ncbi:MAG: hypothetical protein ACR2GB_08715 [Nocardioidaceae bacterium]